ncbi:unnamed protein product [Rotaria sordida]|uniref:KY-like immunoglobulin-like domain-containing protein n=2 Tax=Rotaria sordida TaxID=392033 RepID=A0A820BEC3_9BILA|nr:unnamed protein product [Rotaria sordida]
MGLFDSSQGLAEVLIRASDSIDFTTSMQRIGHEVNKTTSLVQYDADRQLWQCLFVPQTGGFHTLTIYARKVKQMTTQSSTDDNTYPCVAELGLEVPATFSGAKTFPITYSTFSVHKCQILQPLDGSLKAGSKQTIHCRIPGAHCARLLVDGKWLPEIILKNDIFKTEFTVPKREIMVYVKFANKKNISSYDGLIKYSVH